MLPIALNVRVLQAAKDSQCEGGQEQQSVSIRWAREDALLRLIKALDVKATVELKVTYYLDRYHRNSIKTTSGEQHQTLYVAALRFCVLRRDRIPRV